MERKFLIILIFITFGAIAFLSGYILMPKEELDGQAEFITERFDSKVEVSSSESKIPNTLPLSNRKFIAFVNSFFDSKKIVAATMNGDIVEINTTNLAEKVIYTVRGGIVEVLLSPAGDSVIYSFYDAKNNKKWGYLNLSVSGRKNGESAEIEGNIRSASFSPRGDQAAYLLNNNERGELLISKNGKIVKKTLKTRLGAAVISWPSEDLISVMSYDKNGYGDLFRLKDNGNLNKVLSSQYDLNAKWAPSGEKIIFSAKNSAGSDLLFYRNIKNGGATVSLDISASASKCIWTVKESIICGITDKTQVKDEFYEINTDDSSKTLIAIPSINLLVKELALNRPEDTLFVLNDIDSKLYALKLGKLGN